MKLSALSLVNFRGYERLTVALETGLTVLVGDNAQGKTNFLRSVELLGLGETRVPSGGALARFGEDRGWVEGRVEREGRQDRLIAEVREPGGVRLSSNGKPVPRPRWMGRLPVLFVGPDDRDQVLGPPSARRALLDALLEQSDAMYLDAMRAYRRALRQRNRALSRPESTADEIAIWEEPLARAGGGLLAARQRALSAMGSRARAWLGELTGADEAEAGLAVAYASEVPSPAALEDPAAWSEALAEALERSREREHAWGSTLVGPHRDDLELAMGGRALKGTGSSGEVWSAVLALAFASAEHLQDRLGAPPVLLLDDVLTALDSARQDRLLGVLRALPQALLTSTGQPFDPDAQPVYAVRSHRLFPQPSGLTPPSAWHDRSRKLFAAC